MPEALQLKMWQTPNFILKLSITCVLLGLIILVWSEAQQTGLPGASRMSPDVKVSLLPDLGTKFIGVSDSDSDCCAVYSGGWQLYFVSVFSLFFKTAA